MKKTLIIIIAAIMVAVCIGLTACTMKLSDPSSITDEKAKLESVQICTENGIWIDLDDDAATQLFSIVKSKGELTGEPLDVAVSGVSTIETTYDYTFKMAFTTGNFFMKKRGEFTYYVGERFKRTYVDSGKVIERIEEEKLVVKRSLSKDTAELTAEQLQTVKDIFEPINAQVMSEAFAKIPAGFEGSAYTVEEIPQEDLASAFYNACGDVTDVKNNLLKGYKVKGPSDTCYAFLTASVEWAAKTDGREKVRRVGRVCYSVGSSASKIGEILKS